MWAFCREDHLCRILDSTYNDIIRHLSFSVWLTSLSMTISRSIPVAANGIILFFLWLSNTPWYMYLLYSFICQSVDIYVASMPWLLWIVLQWTLECMYLSELQYEVCSVKKLLLVILLIYADFTGFLPFPALLLCFLTSSSRDYLPSKHLHLNHFLRITSGRRKP